MIHESALLVRVAKDFLPPVGLNGDRGEPERVCNVLGQGVWVEFTPLKPKNGHPYFGQCWRGFPEISGPKNGKSATVILGRRKGYRLNRYPLAVFTQVMR